MADIEDVPVGPEAQGEHGSVAEHGPEAQAEPISMADINAAVWGHSAVNGAVCEQAKTQLALVVQSEIQRVLEEANQTSAARVHEIQQLAERMGTRLQEDLTEKDRVLQIAQARLNIHLAAANAAAHAEAVKDARALVGSDKLSAKEWFSFFLKAGIEIYISVVEPFAANQKKGSHWLKWTGLGMAILLLLISVCEIIMVAGRGDQRIFKNGKLRLRRIKWTVDVYGVLMCIIAIVLFTFSIRFPPALHIALYSCTFSICMLAYNLTRQFTGKNRAYEVNRFA